MQKESRRNAVIQDDDRRMQTDLEDDIPETTRLKAHLKRRVERQTKQKWVQYATEYASEIAVSGPVEKEAMRRYLDMTREAVETMNRKDKEQRALERERRVRTRNKHSF